MSKLIVIVLAAGSAFRHFDHGGPVHGFVGVLLLIWTAWFLVKGRVEWEA